VSDARAGAPLTALAVPLAAIAPDPEQPRSDAATADLGALAASLAARGVIQPLLVSPHPLPEARAETPYQLIAGERRWAAARLAGLELVPVVVREEPLSRSDRLMLQLDENDGELRRRLSLYDRARAVARALELSGLGNQEFARRHRKSPAWCSHYLKLATATGPLADALREGHLTGILIAELYARLDEVPQRRLLEVARRNGVPITQQQIEIAAQRQRTPAASAAGTAGAAAARERHVIQLTTPQLDTLLVRLGRRPHGSPGARVEQLYACLA
jgi:ParB family chromosome partitioning protein